MIDVFAWIEAWEGRMKEHGYPYARLDVCLDPIIVLHDGPRFSYGWTQDINGMMTMECTCDREAWDEAHRSFVMVDHLRPKCIEPSPMLVSMLTQNELRKDDDD